MRLVFSSLLLLCLLQVPIVRADTAVNDVANNTLNTTNDNVSMVSTSDSKTPKTQSKDESSTPTEEDKVLAIKEILRIGTEVAVAKLARKNGFNKNPDVRIAMPESLDRVRKAMFRLDNMKLVDLFELHMNRTAEHATPKVAGYFILAINQIKIKEPEKILYGKNNSASDHLKKRMKMGLGKVVRPIIKDSMRFAGTYIRYEDLMEEYRKVPFEPNVRGDIENYMVDSILEALFFYIYEEENAIRINPVDHPRATETIKKVLIAQ